MILPERNLTVHSLRQRFDDRFRSGCRIYRAPGRVNLIGEHTDYNDGLVMPAAIDLSAWVAIGPRVDRRLVVHSENIGETAEADLAAGTLRPRKTWTDYAFAVAAALVDAGIDVTGANVLISSEVPIGAGLSSSAAIEVALAYALLGHADFTMERTDVARLCQRAENDFVGARCGIMDQFMATHGLAGHAMMLDCRSLEFTKLTLPERVRLVICNTMVRHRVAAGEYNMRRRDCEDAVRLLSAHLPIRALRDVSIDDLRQYGRELSAVQLRRACHVITEIQRVRHAAAALQHGDLGAFGALMAESHRSLKEDFDVSCPELDTMVDIARPLPGVYGSRMTGGGFGGCTINLVAAPEIERFDASMRAAYEQRTGRRPEIYVCTASNGVQECGRA